MGACFVFFDVFLILVSVFFPPLPVWLKAGFCSADSLINIALCCLGYFPGLIHSWYIISKYPEIVEFDIESQHDGHRSHTIYVNVSGGPTPVSSPPPSGYQQHKAPDSQQYGQYGTIASSSNHSEEPPRYTDLSADQQQQIDPNQGKIQK